MLPGLEPACTLQILHYTSTRQFIALEKSEGGTRTTLVATSSPGLRDDTMVGARVIVIDAREPSGHGRNMTPRVLLGAQSAHMRLKTPN